MAKGDGGLGKADPWPLTDLPIVEQEPSPHYPDGYRNRMPLGGHYETPSEMWLDQMVYPDRPRAGSEGEANALDLRSRFLGISVGNATGRKPGPSEA